MTTPTPKGQRMLMTQENFYKRIEVGESCIDDLREEISALKSRANGLQVDNKNKTEIIHGLRAELYEMIEGREKNNAAFEINMQDSPSEFAQALQDNFWDLVEKNDE